MSTVTFVQAMKLYKGDNIAPESTILDVINDALSVINDSLEKSGEAREKFEAEWEHALGYQSEVDELDQQLAKLPPSYTLFLAMKEKEREESKRRGGRRKKKTKKRQQPYAPSPAHAWDDGSFHQEASPARSTGLGRGPAHHSLNFHLASTTCTNGETTDDIFMLPPEEEQDEDDAMTFGDVQSIADNASISRRPQNVSVSTSKMQKAVKSADQVKLEAREDMLQRIEEMRAREDQIEARLASAEGSTDQDRKEVALALERVRSKNCKGVISMIAEYKPRFIASKLGEKESVSKSARDKEGRLGLNLPSVDDLFDEVNSSFATGSNKLGGDDGSIANHGIGRGHPKREQEIKVELVLPGSLATTKDSRKAPLTSESRGLVENESTRRGHPATELGVLQDPNHFTAIQDLPVVAGDDSDPTCSLRSLVKSNTAPINLMPPYARKRGQVELEEEAMETEHPNLAEEAQESPIIHELECDADNDTNYDEGAEYGSEEFQGDENSESEYGSDDWN